MAAEAIEDQWSIDQSERMRRTRSQTRSFTSRRSGGQTPNRSRRSSPDSQMHRIHSATFPDDQSVYARPEDWERAVQDDDDEAASQDFNEKYDKFPEEGADAPREEVEKDIAPPPSDRSSENADLERQPTNKSKRSQLERDPNMVSWNGTDDPENPRNWPDRKKWAAVVVVSSFTFISPVASSMVAPALRDMAKSLDLHNNVLIQMQLSIFVLAYAIGPMILSPLSEIFGRVPVLQLGNLFFLIFNLACGFAQNGAEMLVFRFLAGLGGSTPLGVGGGVIADLFIPEERGKAIAIYALAPLIGPAIGPIAGGFIAQYSTWRWAFWAVSIACVVIQAFGLFLLQETWAPKLLQRKVKKLQKETGNPDLYAQGVKKETFVHKIEHGLVRPFRLLFTQPIVIALALYMAYLYGLVYLMISSFADLFTSGVYYKESTSISGLNYIALALGYFIGMQTASRVNDRIYRKLKQRNGGKGLPEFRVPVMIPCAILLPIGLFWYGWSAQARTFWIVPDIGMCIIAIGTIFGYQAIQTYVIDSYSTYAASAIAAISFLRSLAGFGFPLFALTMYENLGYGWGNSLLAFVAIAIGVPAPLIFWKYGEKLRARSRFAAGTMT